MVFVVVALVGWTRRHREEPLRKEMQAQPVTGRYLLVDVKASFFGAVTSQQGWLNLDVSGDSFRVYGFPLARFLFGQDYSYRGQDTTIEMIPGFTHDWIEIRGQSSGSAARIWIGRRKINHQLWDALVGAGAHPVGAPPLPDRQSV